MGSCWCKENLRVEAEIGSEQCATEEANTNQNPPVDIEDTATMFPNNGEVVEEYMIDIVHAIGQVRHRFTTTTPLAELQNLAETDKGWCKVMNRLITTVAEGDALCVSAIIIIIDDCPLPSKEAVFQAIESFRVIRERAETFQFTQKHCERNLLVILGCFAEKFLGIKFLTEDIMEYMYAIIERCMKSPAMPDLVLQAVCAIEKFGKDKDYNSQLKNFFTLKAGPENEEILLILEKHVNSANFIWRQVGFASQWLLDNIFVSKDRVLTYTKVDMSNINAMLDIKKTTDLLKIKSDGLEVRCDAHTFESVCCTDRITEGVFYYEAELQTAGIMQIGWATKGLKSNNLDGYGIGDDRHSIAYDGYRCLIWHKAMPKHLDENIWAPGDILGCLIDIPCRLTQFYLNGVNIYESKELFASGSPKEFFAAASLMSGQSARFNFGDQSFRYTPDRPFSTFNEHGRLTPEERQILPHWMQTAKLKATATEDEPEDLCTICYDKKADTKVFPCKHEDFCSDCIEKLKECPLCRSKIWRNYTAPLT